VFPLKKRLLLLKFGGKKIISVFPKETSHVQSLRYLWEKAYPGLQCEPCTQQNPGPMVSEPAEGEGRQGGPDHEDESLHQLPSLRAGDQGLEQAAEKRPSAIRRAHGPESHRRAAFPSFLILAAWLTTWFKVHGTWYKVLKFAFQENLLVAFPFTLHLAPCTFNLCLASGRF
jgi:hypothetical protein